MKRNILSRYERDGEGNSILDVAATRVEDMYSNFDKNSPYIRRDLDQDLVDYLIGCARELSRVPFIIRFTLAVPADEPKVSRIRRSLNSYFLYLAETEVDRILKMFRRSAIFLVIGLAFMSASVWLNRLLGPQPSIPANVFGEGLTLVAWVSLWEALATFLIEWFPHRRNVLLYRRLAHARVVFQPPPDTDPGPEGGSFNMPRAQNVGAA